MKPKVLAICCTFNRFNTLRRTLKCFLDQDYDGEMILLIYNNSSVPINLAPLDLPPNKQIILVNNHLDKYTHGPYRDTGSVFRDALHASPPVDIVTHMDDDDFVLPIHISEGVKGFLKAKELSPNYKAYKPKYSYFRTWQGLDRLWGIIEPSIFVEYNYIMEAGYAPVTSKYHQRWLDPLEMIGELFMDPDGASTLVGDYHPEHNITHTSGRSDSVDGFRDHRRYSQNTGDGTPLTPTDCNQEYYNLVYDHKTPM